MAESASPAGAAPPDPAPPNPVPLLAPPAKLHLRYRPKPEAEVIQADVETQLMVFWPLAREWDSRMRNRNRWIEDEDLRTEVADLSRKHLKGWHVEEPTVVALARAQVVEVLEDKSGPIFGQNFLRLIPFDFTGLIAKNVEREMRRMPWESLLTMAAGKYQNHEKLLVYRRLGGLGDRKETFVTSPVKALFVESAPGALRDVYDFDMELKAVKTYLKDVPVDRQQNLSLAELRAYVEQNQPAIIHLSGIDGFQGFSILQKQAKDGTDPTAEPASESVSGAVPESIPQPSKQASPQQGVYFRDELGQPKAESPEAVAAALCAGAKKPLLVTFNLYNSSARLAAETVARGAAAAIGFQDFIDDTVAEIFFANLFRAWSEQPGTPLLDAFGVAVKELDPYLDRVRGTGVTLWTSEPLLEDARAISLPPPKKKESKGEGTGGPPPVELEFDVEPYPALNYSVLHNGKSKMFETFRVYKFSYDERTDVRVEVNLNVGGRNFPYRQSFRMEHHILDLTEKIAVGLTSSLSRSLRESVRTTIFVRITVGPDDERYCETFDVSLLAVDEWIDDGPSGIFLPSFVLPRDPMIAGVIAKAQRYLMALADDAAQGFDGYQSCGESDDDPAAALEPQARAIWYALQHDFALKYINPPPTFTEYSQRLRTPSEILKTGRGTCIDLALLLAACFEHIGLHPVVFLLTGHAFAGYWADEERRNKFRTTKSDPITDMIADISPLAALALFRNNPEDLAAENILAPTEWKYESRRRTEIHAAVQNGELVAIEGRAARIAHR
jgi:hypothetical protein